MNHGTLESFAESFKYSSIFILKILEKFHLKTHFVDFPLQFQLEFALINEMHFVNYDVSGQVELKNNGHTGT